MQPNRDQSVVDGFGDEWTRFDQSSLRPDDHHSIFNDYFSIFPWQSLPINAIGADVGCGSGRWAKLVAPRVGKLLCIDASNEALQVAQRNLEGLPNCEFHLASVDNLPTEDESIDFIYSLGVLHHTPNTAEGIRSCASKLKKGAPFLLYLYYAFDNRPYWFRWIWKTSEWGRYFVSRMPYLIRFVLSQIIAAFVYFPFARTARLLEKMKLNIENVPLSYYRDKSFYVMQTDSLDRFGTKLEQRFSQRQILEMMENAGLERITFSKSVPYWCAVGYKK